MNAPIDHNKGHYLDQAQVCVQLFIQIRVTLIYCSVWLQTLTNFK